MLQEEERGATPLKTLSLKYFVMDFISSVQAGTLVGEARIPSLLCFKPSLSSG